MDESKSRRERRLLNKKVDRFFNEAISNELLKEANSDTEITVHDELPKDTDSEAEITEYDEFYMDIDSESDSESVSSDSTQASNDSLYDEEDHTLNKDLAVWAVKSGCTREALNSMLAILRLHGHDDLPKDSRTLLKTPRNVEVSEISDGQYHYLGILRGIKNTFQIFPEIKQQDTISLTVNIDGLPLSKSSKSQLWPILGSINDSDHVFNTALFHSNTKPTSLEIFLIDFLENSKDLTAIGVNLFDKTFKFFIDAVICNAPARSFLNV